MRTTITERLGLTHPIIQAPMAGGGSTVAMAAAACQAGALGFLAAAYLSPEQLGKSARDLRSRTGRPFGINLFAPVPAAPAVDPGPALERLAAYHRELGLAPPTIPGASAELFTQRVEAVLKCGASVFSFTFGLLPDWAMDAIKSAGMFVMGTATTVEEAVLLEESGVDAVVAQGSEAGGHRGTFRGAFESAMVGTLALTPQVVDAVGVPVIASGGIMDGRGIAAALALGASAVQMGTAFLTCEEAGIPEVYREAILHAAEDQTRLTRAFSGRLARGIVNRFMDEVEASPESILPYPIQNVLTRPLRNEAARQWKSEFLSLWAGQGVRLARRESTAALIARLADETESVMRRMNALGASGAL